MSTLCYRVKKDHLKKLKVWSIYFRTQLENVTFKNDKLVMDHSNNAFECMLKCNLVCIIIQNSGNHKDFLKEGSAILTNSTIQRIVKGVPNLEETKPLEFSLSNTI